jgi:hypothetical protein
VYSRAERKKLLRTARNRRTLHTPTGWMGSKTGRKFTKWRQTTSNGGASQENYNARNILKDDKKGLLITTSYVP